MAVTKNKYGNDPLKNQYHKIILDRIIDCTYHSNDIINIQALADEFNVSKTPIREALIELCDENLLRSIPKFGYEVIPFQEEQIRQVLEFRYLLETSAMINHWDILTQKQTIQELYYLIDTSDAMRSGAKALDRWDHTARFHIKLASFYKNEYLSEQLEKAIRFLGIEYARSIWNTINPIDEYFGEECHRNIVKEIEKNNKEEALRAMRSDMDNYGQICLNNH